MHSDGSTLFNSERAIGKVYVLSPEAEQLCATKLTPRRQQHNEAKMFRHRSFQSLNFTDSRHGALCWPLHSPSGDFARRRN
jgi:hypothetical protein